jgi:hypothetical protein
LADIGKMAFWDVGDRETAEVRRLTSEVGRGAAGDFSLRGVRWARTIIFGVGRKRLLHLRTKSVR